jgi:hypothetical protein
MTVDPEQTVANVWLRATQFYAIANGISLCRFGSSVLVSGFVVFADQAQPVPW